MPWTYNGMRLHSRGIQTSFGCSWSMTSVPHHSNGLTDFTLHDCQNNLIDSVDKIVAAFNNVKNFLKGLHFTVASNELEPHIHHITTPEGKIISSTGIDASLLEALAQHFQFTYDQVSAKDHEWGVKKNGSWTGLVGMVQRKEADFSLCGITINEVRTKAIRYSIPFVFSEVIFVVAEPKPKPDLFSSLKAISADVWGMGFFSMVSVALILSIKMKTNFFSIMFKLYSNLIGKDINLPLHGHNRMSSKLILAFWMIFAVFLNAIFGGILTSDVIPVSEPVEETLSDLQQAVLNGKLSVGTLEGTIFHQLFQQAEEGLYFDLGASIKTNPESVLVSIDKLGLEKVLKEKYAFVATKNTLDRLFQQMGANKFHPSKDTFWTSNGAVIYSKDCWYADIFDNVIQQTIETGLVDKWTSNEMLKQSPGQNVRTVKKKVITALKLEIVLFPFYALGIGLLASIIAFIGEYLLKFKFKKMKKVVNFRLGY